MSINFANVKAITIPEGSVKSIASGGVTLWALSSPTPQHTTYRLLDSIIFSGNEYILTDHKPTNNRYYYLNFDLSTWSNDKFVFAAGGDADASLGSMRCTVRTSASRFQVRYGRNSSSNSNIGPTSLTANTFYQLRLRLFDDFKVYAAIANDQGTVQGTTYAPSTAQTFTPANMNTFGIMGYGQGTTASNLSAGKVYRYYYRIGDAAGELGCNAYPVQRKSDGRCGLYDTVTSTFYPMEGTNITFAAAGSTVTEEWTPGGYPEDPYIATIYSYDWHANSNNYLWATFNNAFYNLLNTYAPATNCRVKLTADVYNPTEDATYTSTQTNNLTYNTDGYWNNAIFNIDLQYNSSGDKIRINTFRVIQYTSGNEWNATYLAGTNLANLIVTQGCQIKDITLEFIS